MTELQELYIEPAVRSTRLAFWDLFTEVNQIRRDNPNYVQWRIDYCTNPEAFVRRFNDRFYPGTNSGRSSGMPGIRDTYRGALRNGLRVLGEPF